MAEEWERVTRGRDASVVVLGAPLLDTRTTPYDASGALVADVVPQLLRHVAQVERDAARSRQAQGITAAREQGVHMGRPALTRPEGYENVLAEYQDGTISRREAAERLGVGVSTFDKWRRQG